MANILVTGCAGYIGSVLCQELLAAGHHVVGVDNLIYNNGQTILPLLGHPQFQFINEDVRNANAVYEQAGKTADVIIPLAALVGAPICQNRPIAAEQINFQAVADLCDLMSPWQLLIYPNTNSGYGQTDGDRPCVETDTLSPISIYGRTKCRAEQYVLDHHERTTVFRLATVFGASPRMRMDLMVNDFTQQLVDIRERIRLGCQGTDNTFHIFEPHFKRNFVHVRDVSRVFKFAITSFLTDNHMPGVYNFGLPESNLTKLELAHAICQVIGLDKSVVVEGDGKDPDQRNYIVSNIKILNQGFSFNHCLRKGIREVQEICSMFSGAALKKMNNLIVGEVR